MTKLYEGYSIHLAPGVLEEKQKCLDLINTVFNALIGLKRPPEVQADLEKQARFMAQSFNLCWHSMTSSHNAGDVVIDFHPRRDHSFVFRQKGSGVKGVMLYDDDSREWTIELENQ